MLGEYKEVNRAAEKLLSDYIALLSTTVEKRILPLSYNEKEIYPFYPPMSNKIYDNYNNMDDYYYTSEAYDEDVYDDDDDDDDDERVSTPMENNNYNYYYQRSIGQIDWDIEDDDKTSRIKAASGRDNIRLLMPNYHQMNHHFKRSIFFAYLPYIAGCLLILIVTFCLLIIRCLIGKRTKYQYGSGYDKAYVFREVNAYTPEEKALRTLQTNGYENPTYKFFESQIPKC